MVFLKSSDCEAFEVEKSVAVQSQTIKYMIENDCADPCIHLPNISSNILAKVIEYCKRHVKTCNSTTIDEVTDEDLKSFDSDFVKVDQRTLRDLNMAANDLKIKSLLDLTCQTKEHTIKKITYEEVCKIFKMKQDLLLKLLANV